MDPTKTNPEPDETIYVAGNVDWGMEVVKGSVKMPCRKCGAQCWVSPAGQKHLATNPLPIECMECMAKKQATSTEPIEINALPGSIEELRQFFYDKRRN